MLAIGVERPLKPLTHQNFDKMFARELKNKIARSLRNDEAHAYTLPCKAASSQATTVSKYERIQKVRVKILRGNLIGAGPNFCSLSRTSPYAACCDRQLFDLPIT